MGEGLALTIHDRQDLFLAFRRPRARNVQSVNVPRVDGLDDTANAVCEACLQDVGSDAKGGHRLLRGADACEDRVELAVDSRLLVRTLGTPPRKIPPRT